jgi:hypothetical protein
MRSWILGGCLATIAAGGVYFVATGGGSPTHCGPCVSCPTPADSPESPPVVEVVDVAAALAKPAVPPERPFMSFDEPPLAKQLAGRAKAPDVIQAAFEELAPRAEVAPMPRPAPGEIGLGNFWAYPLPDVEVAPTPRPADPMPLAAPDDPF